MFVNVLWEGKFSSDAEEIIAFARVCVPLYESEVIIPRRSIRRWLERIHTHQHILLSTVLSHKLPSRQDDGLPLRP